MLIPRTERIIAETRAPAERVAITLEYLVSFIVWAEKLTLEESCSLRLKIDDLIDSSNTMGLNSILEDCIKYISKGKRLPLLSIT